MDTIQTEEINKITKSISSTIDFISTLIDFISHMALYLLFSIGVIVFLHVIYFVIWIIHDLVLPTKLTVKKVKFDNGLYGIRRFNFEKIRFEYYTEYSKKYKYLIDSKLAWAPYYEIYSECEVWHDGYKIGKVNEMIVDEYLNNL